jgi:hypothetical protein
MRWITLAFVTFALCVAVLGAEQQGVPSQALADRTACELTKSNPSSSTLRVQVRARIRLYAHSAVITDDHCPDVRILLESSEGGPNMSFCDLGLECPLNTEDFLVIATFIGTYEHLGTKSGRLRLERLHDLKRTRLVSVAAPNTSFERTRVRDKVPSSYVGVRAAQLNR